MDFVGSHGRLTGRRDYSDAEAAALIAEPEANDGAFTGMSFYNAASRREWKAVGVETLGQRAPGGLLAHRRVGEGLPGEPPPMGHRGGTRDRDRLRNAIYLALIAYVDHFPLDDFANSEALSLRRPYTPVALH